MAASDDESDVIPLQQQRYFGSGLKRKLINFVPPASTNERNVPPGPAPMTGEQTQAWYLSLFQNGEEATVGANSNSTSDDSATKVGPSRDPICEACNLPIKDGNRILHDQRIDHIRKTKLNTISSVDRTRMGLAVLQRHGYDPDAGVGLGAQAEGMLHPIKATAKASNAGIGYGVDVDEDYLDGKVKANRRPPQPPEPQKLNAKQVREKYKADAEKLKRMREEFYGSSTLG